MDWQAWENRISETLRADSEANFRDLFAPGALFSDPVNKPTTDLDEIENMTESSFPDWHQEVIGVHGDDRGGAFEWIGRGRLGGTIPIEIHGCTMVDVDTSGQVTRWRDYFDLKEIEEQVAAASE